VGCSASQAVFACSSTEKPTLNNKTTLVTTNKNPETAPSTTSCKVSAAPHEPHSIDMTQESAPQETLMHHKNMRLYLTYFDVVKKDKNNRWFKSKKCGVQGQNATFAKPHLLSCYATHDQAMQDWDIVFNMTMQLTAEAQQALLSPDLACTTSRTPWCHFSNYETCTSPFSSRYCKWAVGQITPYCLPINQCYQYSAKACPIDRFCKLQGVMCVENASKLPSAPTNQSVACGAIKAMAQCNTALMVNGFSSCYWFQVSGSSVCKSF
jgi:hypothetical protein